MSLALQLSLAAIGAALAIGSITAPAAAVSLYSVTDLGSLNPLDFNDSGQIIGKDSDRSFLWQNGATVDLTSMGASAINNLGQIVGVKDGQLFLRQADGTIINNFLTLPCDSATSPRCGYINAIDINDSGQILSFSSLGYANHAHPLAPSLYLQQPAAKSTILFTSNEGEYFSHGALNDRGQIAYTSGQFRTLPSTLRAWLADGDATAQMSFPPVAFSPSGTPLYPCTNSTSDINNQGRVVGYTRYDNERLMFCYERSIQATLWTDANTAINLGTLGGTHSKAIAINDLTQVVGWANNSSEQQAATIWENNQIFDLNNFLVNGTGWQLTSANFINNNGQIIASGTFNGIARTVLLNPVKEKVPEPAGLLGLLGIGAIGLVQKRKRLSFSDGGATEEGATLLE